LQHKVKKAHVELGLEIAKASIVAINPASSVAQVQDEIKALKARIDKVSAYPDLSKDDTATIAYKQTLRKTIHEVRVGRNKNASCRLSDRSKRPRQGEEVIVS